MSLHDPFGRMAKRHDSRYQSLKKALISGGIDTEEKAQTTLTQLDKRTRAGLFIVVPCMAVLLYLFQESAPIIGIFGAVILVWLVQTTFHAKKYIQRYIDEELNKPQPKDQRPDATFDDPSPTAKTAPKASETAEPLAAEQQLTAETPEKDADETPKSTDESSAESPTSSKS